MWAINHQNIVFLGADFIAPPSYLKNRKGENRMSKLPNYYKEEILFYLNDKNRVNYNALCKKCKNDCKQSFRVCVLRCDKYISKRSVG